MVTVTDSKSHTHWFVPNVSARQHHQHQHHSEWHAPWAHWVYSRAERYVKAINNNNTLYAVLHIPPSWCHPVHFDQRHVKIQEPSNCIPALLWVLVVFQSLVLRPHLTNNKQTNNNKNSTCRCCTFLFVRLYYLTAETAVEAAVPAALSWSQRGEATVTRRKHVVGKGFKTVPLYE